METPSESTPNSRVRLSPRAFQQASALSNEDYLRYEDALVELSVRLALGEEPEHAEGDRVLEYAGCTLLYRSEVERGCLLVRRVYCYRTPDQQAATRLDEGSTFAALC